MKRTRLKTTRLLLDQDKAEVFVLSKVEAAELIRALVEDLADTGLERRVFRSGSRQFVFVVEDEGYEEPSTPSG